MVILLMRDSVEIEPTYRDLIKELKEKKIRLSYQRVKILDYLNQHRTHPTADEIYTGLIAEIPSLSKTTVYNSLNSLVKANLIQELTIEDNENRYDIVTETHGHFKCEECGRIYDFKVELDSFNPEELKDFQINQKGVYFKGICKKCLETNQKNLQNEE